MHNLVKEIGLAPSELSFSELQRRIINERNRVQEAIMEFMLSPSKQTKTKKRVATKRKPTKNAEEKMLREMLIGLGTSLEALLAEARAENDN